MIDVFLQLDPIADSLDQNEPPQIPQQQK